MPPVRAISRRELISYLRQLGFDGPFSGKRHQFMRKESHKIYIPNPHEGDINRLFLLKLLKQANISREEWEAL